MTYEVGFWTTVFVGFCSFIACLICAKFFVPDFDETSKRSQSNFFWFFFAPMVLPIIYLVAVGIKVQGITLRESVSIAVVVVFVLLFALRKR